MPLRIVTRPGGATLYVRGTVRGQRVFRSTGTSDRGSAEEYRAKYERELFERAIYGSQAVVTFGEAAASYLKTEARSPRTCDNVARLIRHFGTAKLADIDQPALDRAYRAILSAKASNATRLRTVLTPLRAILEHAAIRKWCARPAFEVPRQDKTTTNFLRPAEATLLVQAAAPHLRPLLVFLIGTGARLSEALELDWAAVDLRGARATVWQKQQNNRLVDLPPVVVAAIAALEHREGMVFRPERNNSRVAPVAYAGLGRQHGGQIDTGFHAACRRAGITGLTPHDLRHTWASWHYAVHRDPLRLMVAGGWSGLAMTQRYAHLMPPAYAADCEAWWRGGAELVQAATA